MSESGNKLPEFDKYGRYIESPCYGCEIDDCRLCDREEKEIAK